MNMGRLARRKSLFLATTARLGLHGRLPKDDDGHIEVGPGFAAAAAEVNAATPDDARTDAQKNAAQIEVEGSDSGNSVPAADDDNTGDDAGDDAGDDDAGGEGEEKPAAKRKRSTSQHIRNLSERARAAEERARIAEERAAALENSGLPAARRGDNSEAPAAPDPTDATKYPLGVIDDGFIRDSIKYETALGVRAALDADREAEKSRRELAQAEARAASLKAQADQMTAKGAELFEDFEETVLEGGLSGKWDLTETTFTAAAESEHGPAILHALASDPTEAARVAKLSVTQQVRYVLDKEAELSGKRAERRKPKAGDPPRHQPSGRNGSSPIRLDTDDPHAFHKLWNSQ